MPAGASKSKTGPGISLKKPGRASKDRHTAAVTEEEEEEEGDDGRDPFAVSDAESGHGEGEDIEQPVSEAGEGEELEQEQEQQAVIPPALVTRLLHDFFARDGTRISKDANEAVAKYVEVFVREAIGRAAAEKSTGFLEVEDLEKIGPQLILDL